MLRPAANLEPEFPLLQPTLNGRGKSPDVMLTLPTPGLQPPGDHLVVAWIEMLERQVFQLPLDVCQTEAVCERGIDVQRLPCQALLLLLRQVLQRAHVVEPVGKLDEHDADVIDHRQEHLAVILRLRHLMALEDVRDLRCPVNDLCNGVSELLADVLDLVLSVFGNVMEQCSCHGDVIQRDFFGDDLGDFVGMVKEGLARGTHVMTVGIKAEFKGAADKVGVHFRQRLLANQLEVIQPLLVLWIGHVS